MGIAMMSAERSKDPSTQVGACIVDKNNRILSMGYNGMPAGCDDDTMPWGKSGAPLDNKYFYVCHAELNSILNYRGGNLKDAIIYSTLFPCNECAKAIIQCGIKEVVYMSDKYAMTESTIASKKCLTWLVLHTDHLKQKAGKSRSIFRGNRIVPEYRREHICMTDRREYGHRE